MEKWNHKSLRDHQKRHNHRENPSFSSTLLDTIYRSIDEGKTEKKQQDHLVFYRDTIMSTRKQKQSSSSSSNIFRHYDDNDGVVVGTKAPNVRRNSLTEFDRRRTRSSSNSFSIFSTSSSSDSSSGYGFSSSESESLHKTQKLRPIRTSLSFSSSSIPHQNSNLEALNTYRTHSAQTQKPNHEKNGFAGRTKSKAFKILYGDVKKTKQPISPGARLASFLNSLFNSSGNAKKAKVANSHESKPPQSSNCSSASSFSRSCLSKTPSSRSGGVKRSVRFCPVSVIVDEDCRPCGQKKILQEEEEEQRSKEELRFHVMKESRRVEEFARELFNNKKKKKKKKKDQDEFHMNYEDDDDDDDDDGLSCASSDLFELDNLSGIGIERYREELPVYETTHFDTNRAIANGFIL